MRQWILNRCLAIIAARKPDFTIGPKDAPPYLRRWWIIPRNRLFNIYLHEISHDDEDRALHDHPWWNVSILLRNSYKEITPTGTYLRKQGSVTFRRANALHRLVLERWNDMSEIKVVPTISLFITGRVTRTWGFACPKGWVAWRDFVDQEQPGTPGKGCGEYS